MLRLDAKSLKGIKRIKQLESTIGTISTVLTGGQIMQMLFKQSKGEIAYNLSSQDWQDFFKIISGLSNEVKNRIIQEAEFQQLAHQDYKQSQFWKAVAEGCMVIIK